MGRTITSRAPKSPADQLADFVRPKNPRSKRGPGTAVRQRHIQEIEQRAKTQDWKGITPGKLVAVYWFCHERVYGVPPMELDRATAWESAMKQAGSMVKRRFDGDVQKAILFMRWVWKREQGREQWRRDNDKTGSRISWKNQFIHDYLFTDWLAEKARREGLA